MPHAHDNRIAVIDYGAGNLFSVVRALAHLGAQVTVADGPAALAAAPRAILPGVGAFGEAMAQLTDRGLVPAIRDFVAAGRPFLGICLGMQLLFSASEEFGLHAGLDLLAGRVTRLASRQDAQGYRLKVPHVGWNRVLITPEGRTSAAALLAGIPDGRFFYFVHSFVAKPADPTWQAAVSRYGDQTFCSLVARDRLFGCQFHPERSGALGLAVYRNFLTLAG
ncbi:MAG: imidazole glycerol phosphate synthase subunit HisH [Thermodesulfobacteriota bacterium]